MILVLRNDHSILDMVRVEDLSDEQFKELQDHASRYCQRVLWHEEPLEEVSSRDVMKWVSDLNQELVEDEILDDNPWEAETRKRVTSAIENIEWDGGEALVRRTEDSVIACRNFKEVETALVEYAEQVWCASVPVLDGEMVEPFDPTVVYEVLEESEVGKRMNDEK